MRRWLALIGFLFFCVQFCFVAVVGVFDHAEYFFGMEIQLFDEFVKTRMELDKTPAVSIGFLYKGNKWVKGYGFSDLEDRAPASAESVYRLASVTKPMTAVAVLQLVEKGKIDLDAEVQTYVPDFPRKKWPVTIRELLGHL